MATGQLSQTINTLITASMYTKQLKFVLIFYLKSFNLSSFYALVEQYVPKGPEDLIFLGSKAFLSYLMQR